MCEISVTNTLEFLFPRGAAQPTIEEMARFVKTLAADKADMESAYKISEERCVYVKFKNETALKKALLENAVKHFFHYSNGKVIEVHMSVAGGNVRYVRIFDLPPEVNDRDITVALEKFGKINRLESEKFPADLGLGDLSTGVRGVHMDIEKEIPPILHIVGRKGRVYYQQMTPRCYICLSEGHFKAACPNKKGRHNKNAEQSSTYADIAGGSSSSCVNIIEVESEKEEAKNNKEEEAGATDNSATVGNTCSNNTTQDSEEEILDDGESEENSEMENNTVDDENNEETAWHRFATVINGYKKAKERDEQARAAEEQRQRRKKSGTRPKTGGVSPPMKKKH